MTTWPHGDRQLPKVVSGDMAVGVGYLNTCMAGYEHQVAGHMISEGLVLEGLAVERTIHDRYAAAKRNPYNEIECSDHYARAMMSYGVFLAACCFEHHGPKGRRGFAPRLAPDNFRCPFTTAEGWGTYAQQSEISHLKSEITLRWGQLRLSTLALAAPAGPRPTRVSATVSGQPVAPSSRWSVPGSVATLGAVLVLASE